MDRTRLLGLALSVLAVAQVGCSDAHREHLELRSAAQSSRFLAAVARGGGADEWTLVAGAVPAARQVWAQRGSIEDLGARIRREGGGWGCELAASSYRVGHIGRFTIADRRAVAVNATQSGASSKQAQAFIADMQRMTMSSLRAIVVAVCPGASLG